ncbi:glycosyltransferase family A protein [Hamadaea sp. NPDC051192]|uniref:glycosyltransferase family A protein n=1 Tax=Hamadaea sp. NPDC051192 TaxID=3154940 RepID=UPI00342C0DF9
MDAVLSVARLILAIPFAVAGFAALADPISARRAASAWGVPGRAVNATIAVATLGAIGAAVGLTVTASAWASAAVAAGVLLVLAGLAVARMVSGKPSPATVSLLARSLTLAVPAGIVLWEGRSNAGPSILPWLAGITPAQQFAIVAGMVVVGIAWWPRAEPRVQPSIAPRVGPSIAPTADGEAAPPSETAVHGERDASRQVEEQPIRQAPALIRKTPALTIGMAVFDDFDGVYFTLQALRLYHDLDDAELLVVDNFGCAHTREFVADWVGGTYVLADQVAGTAYAKNLVFERASGAAVLCCDSHVLFEPGVIARLKRFYRDRPDCRDLLQGPLVYDDGTQVSTHFEPVWREQMWGVWATDPRGREPDGEPFEIAMQGLGAFSCRAEAWPGFHPGFRGFGGEEGYLHEKVRRRGGRCLCMPWLRWMHRFNRPRGVPYPLTVDDKLRNYLLGHVDLGLEVEPVLTHFADHLPAARIEAVLAEVEATVIPRAERTLR